MQKSGTLTYRVGLLIIPSMLLVLFACDNSGVEKRRSEKMNQAKEMPTYVIEREIDGIGSSTDQELKAGSKKSNLVIEELGPDIRWMHSYVVDNKLYCVYKAKDVSLIKKHARKVGVPANSISKVSAIINPKTGE